MGRSTILKSKKKLFVVAVCLAIVVAGAGGWAIWKNRRAEAEAEAIKQLEAMGIMVTLSTDRAHAQGIVLLPNAEEDLEKTTRLAAQLPYLEVLRLSGSSVTDQQLAHVASCRSLTMIGLNKTKIGDAGLQHLVGLRNIKALYLAETDITSQGLKSIGSLPSIEILDLSNTKVSGDFSQLVKLDELKHFILSGVPLTDSAMESFAQLKEMSRLTIRGCGVSDESIKKLLQAKPNLSIDQ